MTRRQWPRSVALPLTILTASLARGAEGPAFASLAAEAEKAVHDHLHAQPPALNRVDVSKKHWGKTVLALKPRKVVMKGANLETVAQEKPTEAGLYHSPTISSQMLQARDYASLESVGAVKAIPTGTFYRYRRVQERER